MKRIILCPVVGFQKRLYINEQPLSRGIKSENYSKPSAEGDEFMKIFIDADGCPVVEEAEAAAKKFGLECIIICDTSHEFYSNYSEIRTVSKGTDSADFALVNAVEKNDIAVTQDYGLAALCLARGCFPINQNGVVYSEDNIDSMLFARYNSGRIRRNGGRLKGLPKRKNKQNRIFFENLCCLIAQYIK